MKKEEDYQDILAICQSTEVVAMEVLQKKMDVGPILDYRTLDSLMWFFNDVFHCLLMVFCYFLSIKLYAGRCKRMEYFVSIYKKIVGWSRLRGRGAWRR